MKVSFIPKQIMKKVWWHQQRLLLLSDRSIGCTALWNSSRVIVVVTTNNYVSTNHRIQPQPQQQSLHKIQQRLLQLLLIVMLLSMRHNSNYLDTTITMMINKKNNNNGIFPWKLTNYYYYNNGMIGVSNMDVVVVSAYTTIHRPMPMNNNLNNNNNNNRGIGGIGGGIFRVSSSSTSTTTTGLLGIKGFRSWFELQFPNTVTEVRTVVVPSSSSTSSSQKRKISSSSTSSSSYKNTTSSTYSRNQTTTTNMMMQQRNKKQNNTKNGIMNHTINDDSKNHNNNNNIYDHVLIDMNQILHVIVRKSKNIHHTILLLMMELNTIVKYIAIPYQSLVLVLDGSPSAAKLCTQRKRRTIVYYKSYRRMKNNNSTITIHNQRHRRRRRQSNNNQSPESVEGGNVDSDSNVSTLCITPGTQFMNHIEQALYYWSYQLLSSSSSSSSSVSVSPKNIYISSSLVPGEGEIKLLEWIYYHSSNSKEKKKKVIKNDDESIAIIGGDSDLVLEGLILPIIQYNDQCNNNTNNNNSGINQTRNTIINTKNVFVLLPDGNHKYIKVSLWDTTCNIIQQYLPHLIPTTTTTNTTTTAKNNNTSRTINDIFVPSSVSSSMSSSFYSNIMNVRIDLVLLFILNGNDYLPKLRGSSGFHKLFSIYIKLHTEWYHRHCRSSSSSSSSSSENMTTTDVNPAVAYYIIDPTTLQFNLPFAIEFFTLLSKLTPPYIKSYTNNTIISSTTNDTIISSSNSNNDHNHHDTPLHQLYQLYDAGYIPGPINFTIFRQNHDDDDETEILPTDNDDENGYTSDDGMINNNIELEVQDYDTDRDMVPLRLLLGEPNSTTNELLSYEILIPTGSSIKKGKHQLAAIAIAEWNVKNKNNNTKTINNTSKNGSIYTPLQQLHHLLDVGYISKPINFELGEKNVVIDSIEDDETFSLEDDISISHPTDGINKEIDHGNGEIDDKMLLQLHLGEPKSEDFLSYDIWIPRGSSIKKAKHQLAAIAISEWSKENDGTEQESFDTNDEMNIEEEIRNGIESILPKYNWELRRSAPAEIEPYLYGLLWNLQTYQDGVCADYGYNYGKRLSPVAKDISDFLQKALNENRTVGPYELHPTPLKPPISAGLACLAALPTEVKYYVPEPYRYIPDDAVEQYYATCMDSNTNVFDMQGFEDLCYGHIHNLEEDDGQNNRRPNQRNDQHYWTIVSRVNKPILQPFDPPKPISDRFATLKPNNRIRISRCQANVLPKGRFGNHI